MVKINNILISKNLIKNALLITTSILLLFFLLSYNFFVKPIAVNSVEGAVSATDNVNVVQESSPTPDVQPVAQAPVNTTQEKPSKTSSTNEKNNQDNVSAVINSGVVGLPTRLVIPSIRVDAYIEHIGLTASGSVGVPDNAKDVSWFTDGPKPGEMGSALISGHYGIWKNGANSVFNLLPDIKIGDEIYVKDDQGSTRSFVVESTRVVSKDDTVPELFNRDDDKYLNIITCHGQYLPSEQTYSQRLIVFARMKN